MKQIQKSVPLFPPYRVNTGAVNKLDIDNLLPLFYGGEMFSTFGELISDSIITLLSKDGLEEEVLKIIKEKYPDKMLLPSSYMIGNEGNKGNKIVTLDVKNYGFLAFPGGKGDGGVLAELLDIRWGNVSHILNGETDLQQAIKLLQEYRVSPGVNFFKKFILTFCSNLDLGLPNNHTLESLLGFESDKIKELFKKKLPHISQSRWLDEILRYTPETFKQILHREYLEETGRSITRSELDSVFLEEKSPHLLKVRMYYKGNVGAENKILHTHTRTEKEAGIANKKISNRNLLEFMKIQLMQKMGFSKGYRGKHELKNKKISTALGHLFACYYNDFSDKNFPRKK